MSQNVLHTVGLLGDDVVGSFMYLFKVMVIMGFQSKIS